MESSACLLNQALTIEDDMIHYVDCGAAMILPSNNTVNGQILPDELHPNTNGYKIMAACLGPIVDNLVACTRCPSLC